MLTRSLLFRIAGPTVFMSLLFLGSCITAAFFVHHQQSASVRVLDEAIASRKIAGELLKALDDLAALPADRRDEASALHSHILGLLAHAKRVWIRQRRPGLWTGWRIASIAICDVRRRPCLGSAPGATGREAAPHPGGGSRADLPRVRAL